MMSKYHDSVRVQKVAEFVLIFFFQNRRYMVWLPEFFYLLIQNLRMAQFFMWMELLRCISIQ